MAYRVGDRVRIRRTHPWAQGVVGTITTPYDPDLSHIHDPQPFREVKTTQGWVRLYTVAFDEPIDDGAGGGPFEGLEVREDQCRPLPT